MSSGFVNAFSKACLRQMPRLQKSSNVSSLVSALRNDDRVADDVPAGHAGDDLRERRRARETVFAGLQRRGALGDAVPGLRQPGGRDDALVGEPAEDLRRRRAEGKEDDGLARRCRLAGMFEAEVEVERDGEEQQAEEQAETKDPSAGAQRDPGGALEGVNATPARERSRELDSPPGARPRPPGRDPPSTRPGEAAAPPRSDVRVSSWKRTGRPVRRSNLPAKDRMRPANGLSTPSGERGMPKTASRDLLLRRRSGPARRARPRRSSGGG